MKKQQKKAATESRVPKASRPHMPGYGMPTGTKGLLTWAWAEQRLQSLAQLLPDDGAARCDAACDAGVGHLGGRPLLFQHRRAVAQGAQPRRELRVRGLHRQRRRSGHRRRHGVADGDATRIAELSPQLRAESTSRSTLIRRWARSSRSVRKVVFGLREKTFRSTTRWIFSTSR